MKVVREAHDVINFPSKASTDAGPLAQQHNDQTVLIQQAGRRLELHA